jgi:maltooligosyltrehalose trehalohydrolase
MQMISAPACRNLPIGAQVIAAGGTRFRVWAPAAESVSVRLFGDDGAPHEPVALRSEGDGYFSGKIALARAGMRYKYVLPQGEFPDPASRFQPEGPHGPSQIVDPRAFVWSDVEWAGVTREGQIIYEMHVGTFTREGNWAAATQELDKLADVGVTLLELMPVADFAGKYGWGYDGVNLYAPTRLYGSPDDLRRFVNRAHTLGMGVILDVVYNHLGPDGNYLREFSPYYFSKRYQNEWGEALNFDDEHCAPVREFIVANAGYWIAEFHLDGLRLDATQQIFDTSATHLLADIAQRVREEAAGRGTFLVAENEPQCAGLVRPIERGGYGLDALWNDDFHHCAIVALTGKNEAYYTDYRGTPQEFVSAAKRGFLFQGQRYKWQKHRRGTPSLDLSPLQFVTFIQNHDQVANSLWGQRINTITSDARARAITAFLLLGPNTPMLFQGQEYGASTPFLYFADHNPELAALVARGRAEFLNQFPSIASSPAIAALIPNPELERTFLSSKLDPEERRKNEPVTAMHRDLIALRKATSHITHALPGSYDGAVLGTTAFLLRYFGLNGDDRLLIVNLGPGLHLDPAPEPLLAPVNGLPWNLLWSSEDPRYGGGGTSPIDSDENWRLPAESALFLAPSFEIA